MFDVKKSDFLSVKDGDWKDFFFFFDGRVNRKKYWMNFALPVVLTYIIFPSIAGGLFGAKAASLTSMLISLLVIWPKLALGAKRLHDRELTGWWQAAPIMLLFIAGILSNIFSPLGILFGLVGAGFYIWLIVQIGFLKGTDGPNRFGEDPLLLEEKTCCSHCGCDAQAESKAKNVDVEPVGAGE